MEFRSDVTPAWRHAALSCTPRRNGYTGAYSEAQLSCRLLRCSLPRRNADPSRLPRLPNSCKLVAARTQTPLSILGERMQNRLSLELVSDLLCRLLTVPPRLIHNQADDQADHRHQFLNTWELPRK